MQLNESSSFVYVMPLQMACKSELLIHSSSGPVRTINNIKHGVSQHLLYSLDLAVLWATKETLWHWKSFGDNEGYKITGMVWSSSENNMESGTLQTIGQGAWQSSIVGDAVENKMIVLL